MLRVLQDFILEQKFGQRRAGLFLKDQGVRLDEVKEAIPTLFGIIERFRDGDGAEFDALLGLQKPPNRPRAQAPLAAKM